MKKTPFIVFTRHFRILPYLLTLLFVASSSVLASAMTEPVTGWDSFQSSGISQKTKRNWVSGGLKGDGEATVFDSKTPSITWWANTKLRLYKGGFGKPKFDIRWYAPDNSLFFQETIQKGANQGYYFKSKLNIADTPAAKMPGDWRVEVYHDEELVEKRPFRILGPNGEVPVKQTAGSLSAASNDTLVKQDEAYKKAKELFASGNYDEAAALLQQLLKDQPFRTDAHFALASAYFRQEKWDDSIRELDYVLQNPQYRDQALGLREQILKMQAAHNEKN